jgi:hypothetical protein
MGTENALNLIAAERRRQIDAEGYSIEHDREHGPIVLQQAARCYVSADSTFWPWAPETFKPKGPLRNLVRAGALYLAAIDVCANDRYVEYLRAQLDDVIVRIDAVVADARETLRDEIERLTAERDRARDAAVALEQQNAEALRVAQDALAQVFVQPSIKLLSGALYDIQRVLGAGDD